MLLSDIKTTGYETLLLDRDGTINKQIVGDYVRKWSDFEFIPGALETLAAFSRQFKHIFIVTNQRGITKGLFTEADLEDTHRRMVQEITKAGGRIDGIYYSTALTEADIRRKPGRGMFDDILRDYPDVSPATTLMVGDSDSDQGFAANCGIAFQRVDSIKKNMEVIILAGGLGTRLRSEVADRPKCMAPVNDQPFLYYILEYLKRYPVSKVILSVGYLREYIIDWVSANCDNYPFVFDYAVEEEPLGTGGGIKLALSHASSDNVIVLNGDTFFDVNLNELCNSHLASGSSITLALKPMTSFDRYGSVVINSTDNHIVEFREKQFCEQGLINGGVYVINRNRPIFQGLPAKFSFETAVLEQQCRLGNLSGVVQNGYFIDIGIPEDYHKAQNELREVL